MFGGCSEKNELWALMIFICLWWHGYIYLSCPCSPPLPSLCLHLSQHDMVWKLPVWLLMMINVHSHVSNLGALDVSENVTRSNLLRELITHCTCCLQPELESFWTSPSSTSWALLGSSREEPSGAEGNTPIRDTDPISWSYVVSTHHEAMCKGHSCPPTPPIREANEELNFSTSRCLSSLWRWLPASGTIASTSTVTRRPAAQSRSEHRRFNDNKLLASPLRWIYLTDVCLVLAIVSHYSFGDYAQLETITIKEVWTCSIFTSHPLLPCSEV